MILFFPAINDFTQSYTSSHPLEDLGPTTIIKDFIGLKNMEIVVD